MIEFTFYSTDPADYDASRDGCKVATESVANSYEINGNEFAVCEAGNEPAVREAAKQSNLPPGKYIAIQSDSDLSSDIIGWGWIVEIAVPTTAVVRVLQ